jgi:hypothetical protein
MLTGRRDPTDRIVITGFFSVPNKHDFGRHRYYLLELKTRGRSLHFVVAACFGFGTGHEVVQKGRAEQWFGTLGSPVGLSIESRFVGWLFHRHRPAASSSLFFLNAFTHSWMIEASFSPDLKVPNRSSSVKIWYSLFSPKSGVSNSC